MNTFMSLGGNNYRHAPSSLALWSSEEAETRCCSTAGTLSTVTPATAHKTDNLRDPESQRERQLMGLRTTVLMVSQTDSVASRAVGILKYSIPTNPPHITMLYAYGLLVFCFLF